MRKKFFNKLDETTFKNTNEEKKLNYNITKCFEVENCINFL